MSRSEFQRFKAIKARLGADTNDEAISKLMDIYEERQEDDSDE